MLTVFNKGISSLDLVLGVVAILLIFLLVSPSRRRPKGAHLLYPRDEVHVVPKWSGKIADPYFISGLRLPPGPRRKPIVGNLSDMPKHHEWETLSQWAKKYGDLVYVNVLGQPIIFVNSVEVAHDLFETRSSQFSDRPTSPMMMLMGWEWNFGFYPADHLWRRHRKLFHQKFQPAAAVAYHSIQKRRARDLLQRLHESPDDFMGHLRHFAGAIIMEVVYGINVLPEGDHYINIAETAMAGAAAATVPGAFLVDVLPFLKYVPEWMPGAGFQRKARFWRAATTEMNVAPFMAVKEALSTGTAKPSFTASLLEELSQKRDAPPDEEDIIRNTAAMAYTAGADTIVLAMNTFMLAMVLYPRTQRTAQAELDAVLGVNCLPSFEDRKSLPYVNALWKEVQRWYPVTPTGGIPHRIMQEGIYGEHFIPAGSIVIGNTWAMLHDENTYGPRPYEFEPERFLKPGVPDPVSSGAFGFGRRICPGRYMADDSVFIVVASVLKSFDISRARDASGKEIPVEGLFTSGVMVGPEPFQCTIRARSAVAESLILDRTDA